MKDTIPICVTTYVSQTSSDWGWSQGSQLGEARASADDKWRPFDNSCSAIAFGKSKTKLTLFLYCHITPSMHPKTNWCGCTISFSNFPIASLTSSSSSLTISLHATFAVKLKSKQFVCLCQIETYWAQTLPNTTVLYHSRKWKTNYAVSFDLHIYVFERNLQNQTFPRNEYIKYISIEFFCFMIIF